MQLPTKFVDISMMLDNETVTDPDVMRPNIEYMKGADNADVICSFSPV